MPDFTLGFESEEDGQLTPFTEPEPYQPVLVELGKFLDQGKVKPHFPGRFTMTCDDDGVISITNRRVISASQKTLHQLETLASKGAKALGKVLHAVDKTDIEKVLEEWLEEQGGDLDRLLLAVAFGQASLHVPAELRRNQVWVLRAIWSIKHDGAKDAGLDARRYSDWAFDHSHGGLPHPTYDGAFGETVNKTIAWRVERFFMERNRRLAPDIRIC